MRSTLGAQAMSENNPSSENTESNEIRDVKSFGFNRAFASRAAAIGLFAVLGTFAVFQSLGGGKKMEEPSTLLASGESIEQEKPDGATAKDSSNPADAMLGKVAEGEKVPVNVAKIVNNQTSIANEPPSANGATNQFGGGQFKSAGANGTLATDDKTNLPKSSPNAANPNAATPNVGATTPPTQPISSPFPAKQPPANSAAAPNVESAPFQSNLKSPEKDLAEKPVSEKQLPAAQPPSTNLPGNNGNSSLPQRSVPAGDGQSGFGASGRNFQLQTDSPSAAPSTPGLTAQTPIPLSQPPATSTTQLPVQPKTANPASGLGAVNPNQPPMNPNATPALGNNNSFQTAPPTADPAARPSLNPLPQNPANTLANTPATNPAAGRMSDDNSPQVQITPKSGNSFGNSSPAANSAPGIPTNPTGNFNSLPSAGQSPAATSSPVSVQQPVQPPTAGGLNSIVNNNQPANNGANGPLVNANGNTANPATNGFSNPPSGNLPNQVGGSNPNFPPSNPTVLPSSNSKLPNAINPQDQANSNLSGAMRTVAATLPTPGDRQLEGIQVPTIAIEKIAPPEIQVNQMAAFSIVVRNTGRVAAEDVTVHDQVPSNTQFVNATPQPAANASSNHLMWQLGTLKPGEEKTIQLNLRPTRAGEIGSVAQVTFATRAAVRSTVTEPILAIEHSGPLQSLLGQNVMLDITVHNKGTGVARDVLIQENVPPQLKYSDNFRELEYAVGTLGPGQSKRIQLTLQAAQVGQFRNIVQAVGTGVAAAKHEIDMEVIAPQLKATSDGPRSRFLKRDTTHRFQVVNQGTAAATNVDLIAKLPRGLKFVGANNQGQYDPRSHAVYWSLPELKPTQSASVQLDTLPIETGPQDIEFQAVADLQQKETLTHSLAVEHLVDVYFEIDDLDDHIEIGSETRYQVRIVNQGTKPAANIRLMVEFANGVRPTNSSGASAGEIQGQRIVFAPIASLNPGEEVQVQIVGMGTQPGEHRVSANLQTDGREINITKEESTRVYADR